MIYEIIVFIDFFENRFNLAVNKKDLNEDTVFLLVYTVVCMLVCNTIS